MTIYQVSHVVDSTTIYYCVIMYHLTYRRVGLIGRISIFVFLWGGICIMTLTHSHIFSPPPPLLTCSRAHLFTCAVISPYDDALIRCHYPHPFGVSLDVETYTLMSRYFESRYLESRQYTPWRQVTLKTRLSCLFI